MGKSLKLSVHELVDFLLRVGDIDNRTYNKETMAEGSKIHSQYQKNQHSGYISERSLKHVFHLRGYEITLFGRADGLIDNESDSFIIEEIKSTNLDIIQYKRAQIEWHLGQAKCYALMAGYELKKNNAIIQLTYISQVNRAFDIEKFVFTLDKLANDVNQYLNDYLDFYEIINAHRENRNRSVEKLAFPFTNKRRGQDTMTMAVTDVVRKGGQILIEAPTGIGKTISTVFPAVQSYGDEINNRIFYLTAKTSGQEMAYAAIQLLRKRGLQIREVILIAKEKSCLNIQDVKACNPDHCPFAKDYYTKLRAVLREMFFSEITFTKEVVREYALRYQMCPFELQLDLSVYCDFIIGDYNYFFDPQVFLQRHFEMESPDTVILVDEAHNLVERAQSMYSATINTYDFNTLVEKFKTIKDVPRFKTRIAALKRELKEIDEGLELNKEHIFLSFPAHLLLEIDKFIVEAKKMIKDHPEYAFKNEFYPFFFAANRFLKIYEFFGDNYCGYFLKEYRSSFRINLLCLDASRYLKISYQSVRSVILFSATLTPIKYYGEVLGLSKPFNTLVLPSPFSNKSMLTLINPNISVKKDDRQNSYLSVAASIRAFIGPKIGNYFIFVPSYEYLSVLPSLLQNMNAELVVQKRDMSDEDRSAFLSKFPRTPVKTTVGLMVMGGVFSEGIDMIEDRLIGVVIIGVGMPSVSFERRVMQNYYNSRELDGFMYALTIPGINKVRQAVGRLIRSETDVGAALFVESRYLRRPYNSLFKGQLGNYEYVTDEDQIEYRLWEFYKKQ